ncbi:hypothetical protein BdWA1_000548 [Babesia duncani]|uniref:Uncharacterized protein n=1 Tax=Babesia duncani TaxID=323732 RepID=A0AAD9UQ19_9APIC|nr:hypothetical protein BdWA1_000548 [Babesia duncani]
MVDLWDTVLMYNHLSKHFRANMSLKSGYESIISPLLGKIMLIICMVVLFLLGLTFPTVDGDKAALINSASRLSLAWWSSFKRFLKNTFKRDQSMISVASIDKGEEYDMDSILESSHTNRVKNDSTFSTMYGLTGQIQLVGAFSNTIDMFTIAKFTFLIGFFAIDIPFLIYRIHLVFTQNILCLMLYKNILFLFMRPYRLSLFQLAERDRAKGWQTAIYKGDSVSCDDQIKRAEDEIFKFFDDPSSDADVDPSTKPTNPLGSNRAFSFNETFGRRQTMQQNGFCRIASLRRTRDFCHEMALITDFQQPRKSLDIVGTPANIDEKYRSVLMQFMERKSGLPISTFNFKFAFQHMNLIWRYFSIYNEQWFEGFEVIVTSLEHTCFVLSLVVVVLSRIVIAVLSFSVPKIRSPRFMFDSQVYTMSAIEAVNYSMIFLGPIFLLLLFITAGINVFDVLCLSIKEAANLLSYAICVCAMRDTISSHSSWCFYLLQAGAFLVWPIMLLIYTLRYYKNPPFIMYISCKFGTCPASVNYKFCSLELIKSVWVVDDLLHAQWSSLIYSTLFRILCCSVAASKALFGVVLTDLFLGLGYTVYCQTLRVLTLRKHEVNYLLLARESPNKNKVESDPNSFTLADVRRYIQHQGLLSSPGILYPAFM